MLTPCDSGIFVKTIDLVDFTGRAKDTVRKRLKMAAVPFRQGAKGPEYLSRPAFEAVLFPDAPKDKRIVGYDETNEEVLDPQHQAARLDKLRGDKLQVEIDMLRDKLVDKQNFLSGLASKAVALRQSIIGLATNCATILENKSADEVQAILGKQCHELCEQLAAIVSGSWDGISAAEEADGL